MFQRFRLVKFVEKSKTRVKNLNIEKIIAFEKNLPELFFAFYFHQPIPIFDSFVGNVFQNPIGTLNDLSERMIFFLPKQGNSYLNT